MFKARQPPALTRGAARKTQLGGRRGLRVVALSPSPCVHLIAEGREARLRGEPTDVGGPRVLGPRTL